MSEQTNQFSQNITLEKFFHSGLLASVVTEELVDDVLTQTGKHSQRVRLLPATATIYYVFSMSLFRDLPTEVVYPWLAGRTNFVDNKGNEIPKISKSAICHARSRLGPEPFKLIANKLFSPIAHDEQKSAWYKNLRVVSVDGSNFDIPDTQKNAKYFGYPGSANGYAAFPQARVLALTECGTHAVIGATIGLANTSEQALAFQLLPDKLLKNMLLLADRNFYGYKLFRECATHSELLWRIKKSLKLEREVELPDGSFLSTIYDSQNRKKCVPTTVRVIEFTITNDDKTKEFYRLITTLLDHELYPANELATLYHERWEEEGCLREIKDFLNYNKKLIRSQRPDLVLQEIWALLILHHIIRSTMNKAALNIEKDSDILSFTSSLRIIKQFLPYFHSVGTSNYGMEIQNIIYKISLTRADRSKGESSPRGVKKRLSKYPVRHRDQPLHVPNKLELVILRQ
jgi:hypothetical protein